MNNPPQQLTGLVVAAYGKRYVVALGDGRRISCVTRGKKTDLACGDHVTIKQTGHNEGVVESNATRTSLLYRSNAFKSKILASNITQVLIVLATQPSFYEALLNRCLIATEAANIKPIIVLNKCDLAETNQAKAKLALYENLGYHTVYLSAKNNVAALVPYLEKQRSVLVGQSGMGKSTIINALLPDQTVRTQEVSAVLDSGKHTTTATHLYFLNAHSSLIDSPGLQEFGLNHLSQQDMELAFIEFRPFLGHCRFNNCQHLHEPDCAIIEAVKKHLITEIRLSFYQTMLKELALT